jgi:hypothetical protein
MTTAELEEPGEERSKRGEAGAGVRGVIDVRAPVPTACQVAVPTLHEAIFSGKKRDVKCELLWFAHGSTGCGKPFWPPP